MAELTRANTCFAPTGTKVESKLCWLHEHARVRALDAHPKALVPTTCMVMSPRAAWMSMEAPDEAAAARRWMSSALASFISPEYALRLPE